MIQAKRANAMSHMIADNFRDMGERLPEMDIDKRRGSVRGSVNFRGIHGVFIHKKES